MVRLRSPQVFMIVKINYVLFYADDNYRVHRTQKLNYVSYVSMW